MDWVDIGSYRSRQDNEQIYNTMSIMHCIRRIRKNNPVAFSSNQIYKHLGSSFNQPGGGILFNPYTEDNTGKDRENLGYKKISEVWELRQTQKKKIADTLKKIHWWQKDELTYLISMKGTEFLPQTQVL